MLLIMKKYIYISFTDLFSTSFFHVTCNQTPIFPMFGDKLKDLSIFRIIPWFSDFFRSNSSPSLRTLRWISVFYTSCNFFPFSIKFIMKLNQQFIFRGSPNFYVSFYFLLFIFFNFHFFFLIFGVFLFFIFLFI